MTSPQETTGNLQRRYAVFISYRHTDNKDLGRQWATWLHQALETYEIPKDLAGGKNNSGETIPSSLYPVFRDEEELSANADLKQSIYRALENTSLLVVICSPGAVQSKYVADEIRYFKQIGKSSRILALMIEGEPNASGGTAKELECLPEPLRFGVPREDGTIDWTARVTDPILADTRPEGKPLQGWTTGAAYREKLERTEK
ncbi:MAG TPA: toll/interleukin-1 receptor domain-containing protein, partial [Candidatus Baltobacteraceae bacterium]|nr:toll/interleukin-1 receptor domain-containing protein [Candidatus Baltobacteraceae bacterium]